MQVTKKILTFKLKSVIIAEKRDDEMIARFSNFIYYHLLQIWYKNDIMYQGDKDGKKSNQDRIE